MYSPLNISERQRQSYSMAGAVDNSVPGFKLLVVAPQQSHYPSWSTRSITYMKIIWRQWKWNLWMISNAI